MNGSRLGTCLEDFMSREAVGMTFVNMALNRRFVGVLRAQVGGR